MNRGARETGPALESRYRFLLWLAPAAERFPRNRKFLVGDRVDGAGHAGVPGDLRPEPPRPTRASQRRETAVPVPATSVVSTRGGTSAPPVPSTKRGAGRGPSCTGGEAAVGPKAERRRTGPIAHGRGSDLFDGIASFSACGKRPCAPPRANEPNPVPQRSPPTSEPRSSGSSGNFRAGAAVQAAATSCTASFRPRRNRDFRRFRPKARRPDAAPCGERPRRAKKYGGVATGSIASSETHNTVKFPRNTLFPGSCPTSGTWRWFSNRCRTRQGSAERRSPARTGGARPGSPPARERWAFPRANGRRECPCAAAGFPSRFRAGPDRGNCGRRAGPGRDTGGRVCRRTAGGGRNPGHGSGGCAGCLAGDKFRGGRTTRARGSAAECLYRTANKATNDTCARVGFRAGRRSAA